MPKYVVSSEGPIHVREIEGGSPEHPWVPGTGFPRPPEGWERPELPPIPPRDEWPPLPPWLHPGVGFPIPPTPEHPMVPVPPGSEDGIWPPVKPEWPDVSGKTLALALIYVSRHVARWHWIVVDNEEAKERIKTALEGMGKPEHPIAPGAPPREPKRL